MDWISFTWRYSEEIALDERLTTAEYIIGGLPILLIFLGGAIGGVFGIFGATFNYDYMRKEKRMPMQILVSLGASIVCYLAYFILAVAFQLLLKV